MYVYMCVYIYGVEGCMDACVCLYIYTIPIGMVYMYRTYLSTCRCGILG